MRFAFVWALSVGLDGGPLVELGRHLFYDQRLSVNGQQSCASCHKQELAFTDGRARAVGATGEEHPRGAMSLVNVGARGALTWMDPGVRGLEEQALVPMFGVKPVELGLKGREALVARMLAGDATYRRLFAHAYPGVAVPYSIARVTQALAAFERTIVSRASPYDRYYYGGERTAISEAAQRGEALFFTEGVAGCFRCHAGRDFDGGLHNTAVEPGQTRAFRAPTLRNIAVTAPYMHDGSLKTLEEVIDAYARGGRHAENPRKDKRLTGFALTPRNRADLVEFLRSLTDESVRRDPRFANPWALTQ